MAGFFASAAGDKNRTFDGVHNDNLNATRRILMQNWSEASEYKRFLVVIGTKTPFHLYSALHVMLLGVIGAYQ